MTMTMITTSGN